MEVCPSQRGLEQSRWYSLLSQAWLRLVDVRGGTGPTGGIEGSPHLFGLSKQEEAERTAWETVHLSQETADKNNKTSFTHRIK